MVFIVILSLLSFAGVLFIFYWSFNDRFVRNKSDKILKEIRVEFNKMLVDCDEAVSRNLFVFENKIKELKETIQIAEKRIATLDEKAQADINRIRVLEQLQTNGIEPLPKKKATRKTKAKKTEREVIIEKYLDGDSILSIASDLGKSFSEVEMIISLENKKSDLPGR